MHSFESRVVIVTGGGAGIGRAEAIKSDERRRIPLGGRGMVKDVAHWIVALASPSPAWVTGQVVSVDGGPSIA